VAEFNLIQAPELIAKLARAFGMRQAHIAPTLDEGVKAVVVLEDLSRQGAIRPSMAHSKKRTVSNGVYFQPSVTQEAVLQIINTKTDGTVYSLRRMIVGAPTGNATVLLGLKNSLLGAPSQGVGGAPNLIESPGANAGGFLWFAANNPVPGNLPIPYTTLLGYCPVGSGFLDLDDTFDLALTPGTGFFIMAYAINQPLTVWSVWDEITR
jgi:hypothetical protein